MNEPPQFAGRGIIFTSNGQTRCSLSTVLSERWALGEQADGVGIFCPVIPRRGADNIVREHAGDVDAIVLVRLREKLRAIQALFFACHCNEDDGRFWSMC